MNSSIQQAFSQAQAAGRAAFIPYMTAGFPDPETCLDLLVALDDSGADVIEIGLPFSDPLADGPVIQQAGQQALEHGMTPKLVLDLAARAREKVSAPLVIMTYWNPVLKMGPAVFAERAAAAGVAGTIVPDLPPEEAGDWIEASRKNNLDTIFMVAPTTTPKRRDHVLDISRGFLYYVSLTGVTGADFSVTDQLINELADVRARTGLPVAVGFGVAGPKQAKPLAAVADGVIVGTALIREVMNHEGPAAQIEAAARLAASIHGALAKEEAS